MTDKLRGNPKSLKIVKDSQDFFHKRLWGFLELNIKINQLSSIAHGFYHVIDRFIQLKLTLFFS